MLHLEEPFTRWRTLEPASVLRVRVCGKGANGEEGDSMKQISPKDRRIKTPHNGWRDYA